MNSEELYRIAKKQIADEGVFSEDQIMCLEDMVNILQQAIQLQIEEFASRNL